MNLKLKRPCPRMSLLTPTDTMSEVRKLLQDNRISGLPVVEHEKLRGIISIGNFITCIMGGGMDERVNDNMTIEVDTSNICFT